MENAVYRIIQEGITNARWHSGSKTVEVELVQEDQIVRIAITDWGSGFDTRNLPAATYGLAGMQERAALVGGRFSIMSKLGEGTRIVVELPFAPGPIDLLADGEGRS